MYQSKDSKPASKPAFFDFLQHVSPEYLESLEMQYEEDPQSLPRDWQYFFEAYRLGQTRGGREQGGREPKALKQILPKEGALESSAIIDELRVLELIEAYRKIGHLVAEIDPLQLQKPPFDPKLSLERFKLQSVSKDRIFQAATELGLPPSTISQILAHLKNTYCGSLGVEFHYIRNEEIYNWLKKRIDENENQSKFSAEQKKEILKQLACANHFENFLQNNYTGQKRFSIEGGEALIPALHRSISLSAELGAEEIVIGMAHRGRLNVLVNILNKPVEELFKEFEGAELPEYAEATGDVKYHQGFSSDYPLADEKKVHLSLAPNPSHLEFVNPVVEGMTRAKLEDRYGGDFKRIVPLLIHGDAAAIGQGIVPETLNLSQLNGYRTGGTIHLVVNNQIGFTTMPQDSRSSFYCTDWGKAIQCPIFHVNGNDAEAVIHAVEMAIEYRMKFQRDVFIDIVCYRKYGHNEGDEPRFTQPLMYDVISAQKNPFQIYRDECVESGICDQKTADSYVKDFDTTLSERRAKVKNGKRVLELDVFKGHWAGFSHSKPMELVHSFPSSISEKILNQVVEAIHFFPPDFNALPKFRKMFEVRKERVLKENAYDWAVGEALGFGSLLLEGVHLRLSGQDSVRGTFSHRHAGFADTKTGIRYFPLQNLDSLQGKFHAFDSPLSEAGVLGFDYGYSLASPKTLVIWEAQFGDFANGAQVIIDQFISSGETKWYRMSGITLLLPHGYEGQGPEHSSAKLERFLQLCSQNNMQVCAPTTPAQICHVLRRQMLRKFRKPLIIMSPKSLLRNPLVVSRKEDFTKGSFSNFLVDEVAKPERVIMCSGKVYYDLKKRCGELKKDAKIAFVRLEQLYPLDEPQLKALYERWPKASWLWCQEEPKNMGAWSFIKLKTVELGLDLKYVGRAASASPATGSPLQHARELDELLKGALE